MGSMDDYGDVERNVEYSVYDAWTRGVTGGSSQQGKIEVEQKNDLVSSSTAISENDYRKLRFFGKSFPLI